MNKNFIIQWKSKVNGRTGRGTKLFDQAEAEQLADDLNRDYPDIHHEPLCMENPGRHPPNEADAALPSPVPQETPEEASSSVSSPLPLPVP